jgi:hypothetical protein
MEPLRYKESLHWLKSRPTGEQGGMRIILILFVMLCTALIAVAAI